LQLSRFFFKHTVTPENYTLSLHDALPIWKGLDPALLPEIVQKAHATGLRVSTHIENAADFHNALVAGVDEINHMPGFRYGADIEDRKSTRLNSSHVSISYAVFCLKKKKKK